MKPWPYAILMASEVILPMNTEPSTMLRIHAPDQDRIFVIRRINKTNFQKRFVKPSGILVDVWRTSDTSACAILTHRSSFILPAPFSTAFIKPAPMWQSRRRSNTLFMPLVCKKFWAGFGASHVTKIRGPGFYIRISMSCHL